MKKLLLLAIIIVLGVVIYMNREGEGSDYFESYIDEMIDAGEAKDYEKFVSFFSIHYRDEYGVNYVYLKNIVKNQFEKYDSFEAAFKDLNVSEIYEDESGNRLIDVNMDVVVTGMVGGVPVELIGAKGHPDNISITLRQSFMKDWDIVSIEDLDNPGNSY